MLSLCKSLTDLSDVQISYKMNKFKLKIAFCTILNYITANRLNQISQVLTCDARYRAQKKLTCMLKISMPHFKFSHYFYFHYYLDDTLKKLRRKKLKRLNCIYPREYEEETCLTPSLGPIIVEGLKRHQKTKEVNLLKP